MANHLFCIVFGMLPIAAQAWGGNSLEPRVIGRRRNMPSFVVLAAFPCAGRRGP